MGSPSPFGLGAHVQLETVGGEVLAGTVFAHDGACVVLQQPGSSPFHSNVVLLKEACVHPPSVRATPPAGPVDARLPVVDPKRGAERERKAVAAAQAEAAKIGEGVSAEAQQIFDALAKTLPCRWDGPKIVVLEEITIVDPYGPENCTCLTRDDAAMDRVKKVLVAERQRLRV
eukprot:scaffold3.g6198.t1